MGFDAVGSKVLAGLLEELPKRIVIAGIRESSSGPSAFSANQRRASVSKQKT
jgi:hypothetical protein